MTQETLDHQQQTQSLSRKKRKSKPVAAVKEDVGKYILCLQDVEVGKEARRPQIWCKKGELLKLVKVSKYHITVKKTTPYGYESMKYFSNLAHRWKVVEDINTVKALYE